MTLSRQQIEEIARGCEGVTPGPYDVWREPAPTREAAIAELTHQINASEPFAEAVYLLNANGKCPATTGCGPTSALNAAHFARLDPTTVQALTALALQALDAGQPVATEAMIAAAIDCANWPPDLSAIVEAVMDDTNPLDFSTEQCIALGILLDRNRHASPSIPADKGEPRELDGAELFEIFFNVTKDGVPEELSDDVFEEAAKAINRAFPRAPAPASSVEALDQIAEDVEDVMNGAVLNSHEFNTLRRALWNIRSLAKKEG